MYERRMIFVEKNDVFKALWSFSNTRLKTEINTRIKALIRTEKILSLRSVFEKIRMYSR